MHGSARLAAADDVKETGFLTTQHAAWHGHGGWYDETEHRLQYLRDNGPSHVRAFALTRSGKGVSLVIPSLLIWPESCAATSRRNLGKPLNLAQTGQVCFKFSPIETDGSRYNPLAEVRIFMLRDVADAQNVANIVFKTEANPKDPYWQETAASWAPAWYCTCATRRRSKGRSHVLPIFPRLHSPWHRFSRGTDRAGEFPARSSSSSSAGPPPLASEPRRTPWWRRYGQTLNKAEKDLSGGLMYTTFSFYCDPLVLRNTAASDFRINDLRTLLPGIALSRCSQQRP